jgi:Leucine-rich repeat (LRR) protein
VRSLAIIIFVVGAGLGWIVRSARIQQDAVAAIRRHGGSVLYDGERGSWGVYYLNGKLIVPKWLLQNFGVDYFDNVVWVQLGQGGSAADLRAVRRLGRITGLSLCGPFVTDAGLAELQGLTNLCYFDIGATDFPRTAPTKRAGAARITDAGLAYLNQLSLLSALNLSGTLITDAGLSHLKRLTKLDFICLNDTRITDAGLAQLKEFTDLRILDVRGTQITDAGLEHMAGMTKLRELHLGNTQITDAGLEHLMRVTTLQELDLSGNRVTDAGTQKLKRALPRLRITR